MTYYVLNETLKHTHSLTHSPQNQYSKAKLQTESRKSALSYKLWNTDHH